MATTDEEWETWKIQYNKKYDTPEEEARRRGLWNKTKAKVEEHNEKFARGEVTYKMAVNHFADLEPHESKRMCGVLPRKRPE